MNNSSNFQISTSLFQPPHLKASKLSKRWGEGGEEGRLKGNMVFEETVTKKVYKSKHIKYVVFIQLLQSSSITS